MYFSEFKRFYRWCLPGIFCCLVLPACSKRNNTTQTPTGTTIFIAGSDGAHPVLWTNGSESTLSNTAGTATHVVVSGKDVYVAGFTAESNFVSPGGPSGKYSFWKNGVEAVLAHQGSANSIYIQ